MRRLLLLFGMALCWTTGSAQLTAPFTEQFNAQGPPGGWLDTNLSGSTSANANWKWGNASTNAMGYGGSNITDHSNTGGFYAWADGSSPEEAGVILETDSIDLSSLTQPALEFYLFSNNTTNPGDNVTLTVEYYDGSQWNTVLTYAGDAPDWKYTVVDLSPYPGTGTGNKVVRFSLDQTTTSSSAFYNDFALDDISVMEYPSCFPPFNLVAANVTPTSAELSWDDTTGASSFGVLYGGLGFDPATSGMSSSVTDTFTTVSGLSNNTAYDFYVYTDCGVDGLSDTTGPISFTTLCGIATAPFFEDFETASGTTPPSCWENEAEGGSDWEFDDETGQVPDDADGDHTLGPGNGGILAYIDDSDDDDSTNLLSPEIDITALTNPRLVFWMWSETNSSTPQQFPLHIDVHDNSGWTYDVAIYDIENSGWDRFVVDLSAFSGIIRIRFSGEDLDGAFYKDIAIDDVSVEETPACDIIIKDSIANVTNVQADFYTPDAMSASFEYEFGPCGFSQGTGTTGSGASGVANITGLSPNTCYDVFIRRDCGVNGYSAYTGPFSFTTTCGTYTAPYAQSFDGTAAPMIDNCWNVIANGNAIETVTSTDHGATIPSGPNAVEINDAANGVDQFLISPAFSDLPSGNNRITVQVAFEGGGDPNLIIDTLYAGVMTDPTDPSTFVRIDSLIYPDAGADFVEWSVLFDNTSKIGSAQYIAFQYVNGGGSFEYYLDDFSYEVIPACLPPAEYSLEANNLLATSADLEWGSSQGAKTYIEIGAPGFTPGTGTYIFLDSVAGVADIYSATNLSPQTDYEFYVQDSCSPGGLSAWVGPESFTTPCLPETLPYQEDFAAGTFPSCWERSDDSDVFIEPTCDNRSNVLNFNYTEQATTPVIDVSGATSVGLEVAYLLGAGACDNDPEDGEKFQVEYWDGTQWVVAKTYNGTLPNSFVSEGFLLPPGTFSSEFSLRFNMLDGTTDDWQVDSVVVKQGPACFPPTQLAVADLTDSSAVLDWDGLAATSSYDVWFGPQGFYQGTTTTGGTQVNITNGDSLLVDTLSPNTCYEFVVRGICNTSGDTTDWYGPVQYCTPCAAYSAPLTENFDNVTEPNIPGCWSVIVDGGDVETYDASFPSAFSGPNSVDFYTGSNNSGDMMLVTPLLSDMDQNKLVEFEFYNYTYTEDVYIGTMSNPNDGSTFTPYDTIVYGSYPEDEWIHIRYLFRQYTGTDGYIAIKGEVDGNTFDQFNIDDFSYTNVTCPFPANLVFTGNTASTIDLSWTTGGASNWQIEYGPVGFTPGNGTVVNAQSNPYTLTGLPGGQVYDIYVRDSCGAGDVSLWTGPVRANTSCTPLAAGTYTIGGTNPDYASFNEAAQALNVCGITGPVTFNVAAGTYIDRFHLYGIPGLSSGVAGVSATNTITVNGNGAASIEYDGNGPQATVLMDGTPHVTLNGLTIINTNSTEAWGVLVTGNSDTVTIDDCTIIMDSTSTSGDRSGVIVSGSYENDLQAGAGVDGLTVTNSTILGGYYSIALQGDDASALSTDFDISDNVIRGFYYYGIDLDDLEDVSVTGNTITARSDASTAADGIYAYDVNDFNIDGNTVHTPDYGIYVVDGNDGVTPSNFSTVINNMVISTGDYGVYLNDAVQVDVYHNTIYGKPALVINDDEDLNIYNNILVSDGDFAFESIDAIDATTLVDYNLYYRFGGGDIADDGSSTFADLAAWQTDDASRNANSVEGNPVFVDPTSDLHVIGGLANDAGDATLGVNVDIDGDVRPASGATSVDIGADEYTPLPGDLSVIGADFIKGLCLSTNDSIEIMVRNNIDLVDFSVNPLVAQYDVTGPVNSTGTITVNTGTLATLDTVSMFTGNIDLSVPGIYTLEAYIEPSLVNALNTNDTLMSSVTIEVKPEFVVTPDSAVLVSANDSIQVCVESPFLGAGEIFISEISHYEYSAGAPTGGWPAYKQADDYIEITGPANTDLDGITLEQWENGAMVNSFTFPSGTVLSPNGTAIIAVGQATSSSPSPSDFYYHADISHTWSSSDDAGRILKDANGEIIDAAAYGDNYSFPPASGVTASDWSGSAPDGSTSAGNKLIGPDNNTASNWVNSDAASSPMSPNMLNTGVSLPTPASTGNLIWTLNGNPVDTATCFYVGDTLAPGTYNYVATFSNSCGSYTDTATIVVPSCNAPSNLMAMSVSQSSARVNWDTTGIVANNFEVMYGPAGFDPMGGAGTSMSFNDSTGVITGLAANLCVDVYVRTICGPNENSVWAGPINACPEATPCDDLEVYATGGIEGQSALFLPWEGTPGATGTASVTTAQASGGTQSLRLSNPTGNAADHDDLVAYFDTISSGAWEVAFDLYVPSGSNAYYNIQMNHDLSGGSQNRFGGEVYFQSNGTAQVQYSSGATVAGTFAYQQGQWNTITTVIDIANDSVFVMMNGTSTGVGYDFSLADGLPLQFNAIDFFTGKLTSDAGSSEFFIDNFCVTPSQLAGCPDPTALATVSTGCDTAVVSWSSAGANTASIIEYGPAGFTPGNGTFQSFVSSPATITGLTPGTAYDFYVADTCNNDTSAFIGPESFTTNSKPVASFTYTVGTPTANNLNVVFDATGSTNANSYDWDFGDGSTGSGATPNHDYTSNNAYIVTLVASNDCGTDTITDTLNVQGIGLAEALISHSLNLYPNPASSDVVISFTSESTSGVEVSLWSVSGKKLRSKSYEQHNGLVETTWSVADLPDGVYLVRIESEEGMAVRRLIVE